MSHKQVLHATKVLAKHDPIGLIRMGAPEDEYFFEAREIVETKALSKEQIYKIFFAYFANPVEDDDIPPPNLPPIEDEIWSKISEEIDAAGNQT